VPALPAEDSLYGHGSLWNCVTVAVFPAVPSATVTVVAVFLEISPASTFSVPKLDEKPGKPEKPPSPTISALVL